MCRRKKKNDTFCTSMSRDDEIATGAKLRDIMYKTYGFSAGLIEAMN